MERKNIKPAELLAFDKRYGKTDWAKNDEARIENLIHRMSLLDENEKKLILQLTDKFCYIDLIKALASLNKALQNFIDKNIESNHIIVSPLKSPFINCSKDNRGRFIATKIKSSDTYYAIFKNSFVKGIYASHLKFVFCDTPIDLKNKIQYNSQIILIGDFIGSGTTAIQNIKAYLSYLQEEGVEIEETQFNIVVMVAMEAGIKYIKSHINVDSYYSILQRKGISESPVLNTHKNIKLMNSIENKVLPTLNPTFSFGYKQSESLVSIIEKSPNNTFPFYWYTEKGIKLEAIFRRDI